MENSILDGANKSKINMFNKSRIDKTNIKADKKPDIRAIANTNNSADRSNKVTNQYINFINLIFVFFAILNCISDFNFAIFEKTTLSIIIFIFNNFFITFAAFANTIFEKKTKYI